MGSSTGQIEWMHDGLEAMAPGDGGGDEGGEAWDVRDGTR